MSERAKPYINPYVAGALLGVVLFLAFFITGTGLGASGGLNRVLVYAQNIVTPEHIDQVPYLLKMAGGDTNPLDSWIVYLTLGTVLGGFLSGLFGRRVRLETKKGPRISNRTRWVMAFLGGILMGYGARLARGCRVCSIRFSVLMAFFLRLGGFSNSSYETSGHFFN